MSNRREIIAAKNRAEQEAQKNRKKGIKKIPLNDDDKKKLKDSNCAKSKNFQKKSRKKEFNLNVKKRRK